MKYVKNLVVVLLIILLSSLSIILFGFWLILAGSMLIDNNYITMSKELYQAVIENKYDLSIYLFSMLSGTFGGAIGWISLLIFAVNVGLKKNKISKIIIAGLIIGVLSAILLPVYKVLCIPPIAFSFTFVLL